MASHLPGQRRQRPSAATRCGERVLTSHPNSRHDARVNTDRKEAAKLLAEIATLLRLSGANEFKAMAYDRGSRAVEGLNDFAEHLEAGTVAKVDGIGKSIAMNLNHWAENGSMPALDELRETIDPNLIDWLRISGLGPKNIYKIHRELGIATIDELKVACEDGSVAGLAGLGKKSAAKIIASIDWMEQFADRCHLNEASEISQQFVAALEVLPGVQEISVAGSLRRCLETIGDIDVLVAAKQKDAKAIFDTFVGLDNVTEVLGRGDTKSSVRTAEGRQVDLRIVEKKHYPAALMYFTGSKEHNVALRSRARERGMALNEYGLYRLNTDGDTDFDQPVKFSSEADIYKQLDMHWVPAELREDHGEIDFFESNSEMELVGNEDLCGVLHAHSTWSDGATGIEELARHCIACGYEYLGITDHSQTAAYANGLSPERVQEQWEGNRCA